MKLTEQKIKEVWVIEPKVFTDDRGYFMGTYKKKLFEQHISKVKFIQDNESTIGVLRGLHSQTGEYFQAKLLRALQGKAIDLVVDLRKSSFTFEQHVVAQITKDNKIQLFVPRGISHDLFILSVKVVLLYKVENIYSPRPEGFLLWKDFELDINWRMDESELVLLEKDQEGKDFNFFTKRNLQN